MLCRLEYSVEEIPLSVIFLTVFEKSILDSAISNFPFQFDSNSNICLPNNSVRIKVIVLK